jgi:hypothetical protein
MEKMPRTIRVIAHVQSKRDTGRGFQETISHDHHVYLDTHEVEMIMTPVLGPGPYIVVMRSGHELRVKEDDFNRIERAMRERE